MERLTRSDSKFPDYIWVHLGTNLFYPLLLPSHWDQMLSSLIPIDADAQLIDLSQYPSKPRLIYKLCYSKQGSTPPGVSILPIHLKTNLIMLPFIPDATIKGYKKLGGDSSRSFFTSVVSRGEVEVYPWGSISGCLSFWIALERLFAHLASPSMWKQAGVEFTLDSGQKISGEIVPVAVLVTDKVEEGSLGMVTTFCHHDQAKVESSEALSTKCQWDSPKPSVVVVKIFANSPYLLQGTSSFLYLFHWVC